MALQRIETGDRVVEAADRLGSGTTVSRPRACRDPEGTSPAR